MQDSNDNVLVDAKYKIELLPEDYPKYDMSFKLIVIGDSGVGKSCISNKAVKNIFEDNYNATIGFEFFTFNMKLNDEVIKLQIWDTCGQELYRSLITNFYRNSSLAILVYSVTDKDSFRHLDNWIKELKNYSNPDVKMFLIGNKVDLENERDVLYEDGEKYAKDYEFNVFMETSAKTGLNTKDLFIKAATILYEDYIKYGRERSNSTASEGSFRNNSEIMVLSEKEKEEKKGSCSC
ncbi:MAG: GTP-binding protein [archaeon]|nr:GTP-binding protein [archaeon]